MKRSKVRKHPHYSRISSGHKHGHGHHSNLTFKSSIVSSTLSFLSNLMMHQLTTLMVNRIAPFSIVNNPNNPKNLYTYAYCS